MEAILYRVEVMALIIYLQILLLLLFSSKITEILFLLRRKCPTANIYLFPILPQFDHLKTHFATTNSFIYFQVQEFFSEFFFFHELPSTLYNQNLYRADKLHLTTKGNEILVRWFNHCLTISTSTMQLRTKPTRMPCSLQDVPPTFVITDADCAPPPYPTCSINSPTQLFLLHADTASKALLLYVHVHLHVRVPSQVLIPF